MQSNIHLRSGAQLIAQQLEAIGVRYVFGIPGAKIDRLFDAIEDTKIQMIPVRHEANGAFMAGIMGRLSGRAGVTLATSGPGCGNLVTGVATANSEGDPMIAIGGAVKRDYQQKQTHQSMDTVSIFVLSPNTAPKFNMSMPPAKSWLMHFVSPNRVAKARVLSAYRKMCWPIKPQAKLLSPVLTSPRLKPTQTVCRKP